MKTIEENWIKLKKIEENWRKLKKIEEHWRKLKKLNQKTECRINKSCTLKSTFIVNHSQIHSLIDHQLRHPHIQPFCSQDPRGKCLLVRSWLGQNLVKKVLLTFDPLVCAIWKHKIIDRTKMVLNTTTPEGHGLILAFTLYLASFCPDQTMALNKYHHDPS